MELRTNNLFKSYLQDDTNIKTPSPVAQVTKFRETLAQCEQQKINTSVSRLCTMMENCTVQLQASNNMIEKLTSPDSDFIVVQRQQLTEFFSEFKQEFTKFKTDVREDLMSLAKKESSNTSTSHQPAQTSQHSIFLTQPEAETSQKSIFPSLTPPPSFETNKVDTFAGFLHSHVQPKVEVKQDKPVRPEPKKSPRVFKPPSNIMYKIEKNCKSQVKRSSQTREKKTSINMQKTHDWLETLSIPPPPRPPPPRKSYPSTKSSTTTFKRHKSGNSSDSDNESFTSKWSCKSIRTFSRGNIRGTNILKIKREVRSETGAGTWGKQRDKSRKIRSEW